MTASVAGVEIPVRSVTVADDPLLNITVNSVEIGQEARKHDEAVLTFRAAKESTTYLNKPISFDFGIRPRWRTFYGYIADVSKTEPVNGVQDVQLRCLGATWEMRHSHPRQFLDRTVPEIIRVLVADHGLGTFIDESTIRWNAWGMTTETPWEMVNNLAATVGFDVYTYDGVIQCVDARNLLDTSVPFLRLEKTTQMTDTTRLLLDFNLTTLSSTDLRVKKPVFGYINAAGGPRMSADIDDEHVFATDIYVNDDPTAKVVNTAFEILPELWPYRAEARVRGNSYLQPGMTVEVVTGVSPSNVRENDGVWLVRSVSHSLSAEGYQQQVKLARDRYRPVTERPDYRWFYMDDGRGKPRLYLDAERQRWLSSWR